MVAGILVSGRRLCRDCPAIVTSRVALSRARKGNGALRPRPDPDSDALLLRFAEDRDLDLHDHIRVQRDRKLVVAHGLEGALRQAGTDVGHVHLADSNRRAAGLGHTAFGPVIQALREIGYTGYLSAEVLPLPDPETAARRTLDTVRSLAGPA